MGINNIKKVNATVQGTGVNLEKSSEDIPDKIVNEVGYADNLFEDFSDPDPEKSRDFESMIQCCDKLPYMDGSGSILASNETKFPTYAACENRYEYLHPCGCPQVFIWEYSQGGSLQNAYKEAVGESNYEAHGSPDQHPAIATGTAPATDSMFGQSGANGFWSQYPRDDDDDAYRGKYALRCDNLHIDCTYWVYVIYTTNDEAGDSPYHGGADQYVFTAKDCVHYIGGDSEGNHSSTVIDTLDPPRNTELIPFKDAAATDGFINIKGLHIQMAGVGIGRGESQDPVAALCAIP